MKNSILIVDDDKFLLDMYALKFTECGYQVEIASSGVDVIAKLSNDYRPDIILMDVVMPAMDGFELIGELKKKNLIANSTVVILSNLGQKDDIEKGMRCGAAGYIIKASCTPSEVVNKVADITNLKK